MFRSIRTQLLMIQISSLVLLLVIGLSAIAQVRRLSMDSTRQYALAATMQAKGSIETILENVRVSATSLCYSSSAQEILTTEETDRLRLSELYQQYSGSVSYAINTNNNIVDICLVSSAGETYAFGTQAPQVLIKALEEYTRSGAEGEHFTGFFGPAGGMGIEYYAYLLPVNSAIPGVGFSKQVGLCLVLCRTRAVLEVLRTAMLEGVTLSLSYGEDGVLAAQGGADSSSLESQQFPLEQGSWTLLQQVDPRAALVEDRSSQLLIISFLLAASCFGMRNSLMRPRQCVSPRAMSCNSSPWRSTACWSRSARAHGRTSRTRTGSMRLNSCGASSNFPPYKARSTPIFSTTRSLAFGASRWRTTRTRSPPSR